MITSCMRTPQSELATEIVRFVHSTGISLEREKELGDLPLGDLCDGAGPIPCGVRVGCG
jgi:hypothetical protein